MKSRPTYKAPSHPVAKVVQGQSSWRLASNEMEAFITEKGAHIGPVTFDRKGGRFAPYSVAPWANEPNMASQPPIIQVLRGDFFCLPFGSSAKPYQGERHPIHGETANKTWTFRGLAKSYGRNTLHLSLRTKIRAGRVDKYVTVMDGHLAVYQKHVVSGMSGNINFGHHATLKFPDKPGSGLVSTSPFRIGQVFVEPGELPENKGYSALLPGAYFKSLDKVPSVFGTDADLSRYPARRGYEDLVMMVGDPDLPFAWTAVTFPEQQYVWFAIRDPRVLRNTLFWISNGGRHYAPWNGRHVNVMGLEDVTSYFHLGPVESTARNPVSDAGYPTSVKLDPKKPLVVNYIMAAAKIPKGFDHVSEIEANKDNSGVTLISRSGKKVQAAIDLNFLAT